MFTVVFLSGMAEAGVGNKMLTPGQKQQKRHLRVPFL